MREAILNVLRKRKVANLDQIVRAVEVSKEEVLFTLTMLLQDQDVVAFRTGDGTLGYQLVG